MKSLVIIDDDLEMCAWLADKVNHHPQFSVVATAASGREGMLLVEHHRPNLVILDIIMPDDDGLKVIKHIREKCEQYNPIIFVVTAVASTSMQKLLRDLKIDFVDIKPIFQDNFSKRLNSICSYEPELKNNKLLHSSMMNVNDLVEEALREIGVPVHLAGYRCIKVALFFILDNPNVKIDIYSTIRDVCGCTRSNADRNIRTSIEACMDSALYQKLFGIKKASNLKFLHNLALVVDRRLRGSDV